jgi:hypothetical protein
VFANKVTFSLGLLVANAGYPINKVTLLERRLLRLADKTSAMKDLMKCRLILLAAAMFLTMGAASAQAISADSVKALNNNNRMLRMAISINDQKIQLAKMQHQLSEQNYTVEKTAAASQKSAGKNEDAATSLNNDDQDKSKAKTARKSARTAERASSRARNAQDKMTDIGEDVQSLQKKIAAGEQELTAMGGARYLQ